jgi:hypothetical protein
MACKGDEATPGSLPHRVATLGAIPIRAIRIEQRLVDNETTIFDPPQSVTRGQLNACYSALYACCGKDWCGSSMRAPVWNTCRGAVIFQRLR